jgi:hypothetical protein
VKNENGNGLAGVAVQLWVHTWYGNESDPDTYDCFKNGVSGSGGAVYLECIIPAELSEGMLFMQVSMTDQNYSIISSQNTWSNYAIHIYPVFNVVYDRDGDLLNDNLEQQLAEKFSPVLHKHSWEKQQGLSNVDWILTGKASLKGYNSLGQTIYSANISQPSQIHVYQGSGDWDSFGDGEYWTEWRFNITDTYRYQGAPVGQRPLYYHVYKSGSYYFVQYWLFFNMNDVIDQTNNDSWHEGDFEHVSIKVNSSYDPVAVNFYRHEGGRTVSPSNCWWSSTNNRTYSGIAQGYNSSRTHLHIWIAANSHGAYNRNQDVYRLITTSDIDQFCTNLTEEDYIDNVDYNPSGNDLYFVYDYLENLGEITFSNEAHGDTWFAHYSPSKSISKLWLCFVGRFGQHWAEVCFGQPVGTNSPLSPVFDLSGKPSHQWKSFTENYTPYGFGNPLSYFPFTNVTIIFTNDPPAGD